MLKVQLCAWQHQYVYNWCGQQNPKSWPHNQKKYIQKSLKSIPINYTVTDKLELNKVTVHGSATRPYPGPLLQRPAALSHCDEL